MTETNVTQLNTALANLVGIWEQMADHDDASVGHFQGPTAATLNIEVAQRSSTYRRAAADVREVLRTSMAPQGYQAVADQAAVVERQKSEFETCERLLREAYDEIAQLRSNHPQDDSKAYAELLRTAEPVPETQQDQAST